MTKRADLDEKSWGLLGAFDSVKVITGCNESQGNVGGNGGKGGGKGYREQR
jgi:hypothetical protein